MYGIVLNSVFEYLKQTYGLETARDIINMAENRGEMLQQRNTVTFVIRTPSTATSVDSSGASDDGAASVVSSATKYTLGRSRFVNHQVYSNKLISQIAQATSRMSKVPVDGVFQRFGQYFIRFLRQNGYDNILRFTGRTLRDFVTCLDNMHDYCRNCGYPEMNPPSFSVVQEDPDGLLIHYRSTRGDFDGYVAGVLKEVAKVYFGIQQLTIAILAKDTIEMGDKSCRFSTLIKLEFNNVSHCEREFIRNKNCVDEIRGCFIRADLVMEQVPFYVAFNRDLEILSIGRSLKVVFPNIVGDDFNVIFELVRPDDIGFTWEEILAHKCVIFEVVAYKAYKADNEKRIELRLRGEMIYLKDFDCIVFEATPCLNSLEQMKGIGLRIGDLSKGDLSRDHLLRRQSDAKDDPQYHAEEMAISLTLNLLSKEAAAFRLSRKEAIEEAMPSNRLDMSLDDYQTKLARRAAVICCYVDAEAMFEQADVSPLQVISAVNTFNGHIDCLQAKYSHCMIKSFSRATGDLYVMVVGPPSATKLPAHVALQIACEILDNIKSLSGTSIHPTLIVRTAIDIGPIEARVCTDSIPPRFCIGGGPVRMACSIASRSPVHGSILWTSRMCELLVESDLNGHYSQKPIDVALNNNKRSVVVTAYELQSVNRDVLLEIASKAKPRAITTSAGITRLPQTIQRKSSSSSLNGQMSFIKNAILGTSMKLLPDGMSPTSGRGGVGIISSFFRHARRRRRNRNRVTFAEGSSNSSDSSSNSEEDVEATTTSVMKRISSPSNLQVMIAPRLNNNNKASEDEAEEEEDDGCVVDLTGQAVEPAPEKNTDNAIVITSRSAASALTGQEQSVTSPS